ncbi:MAG: phage holin family protein [Bacteroidota bacterium]
MEHDQFFQEVKLMVSDYLSARIRLLKYDIYEKSAKLSATLFSSMVIAMLASMMLLFLSLALGFYLGSVFDSYGTGFLVVTGIYLAMLLPFILLRKSWIEKTIINRIIEQLTEKEEDEK